MQENDTENESLPLGPRLLLWGYKENIYLSMIYNATVSVLKPQFNTFNTFIWRHLPLIVHGALQYSNNRKN